MSQNRGMNMVFVLVVSAIFCAAATFIAISLASGRSASAPTPIPASPSEEVFVDGVLVSLDTDPALAISIPGELSPGAGLESQTLITPFPLGTLQPSPVFLPTGTLPAVAPALPTRDPNQVIFISYVVQSGDNLYGIAAAQNSAIELMALHGIDDDDLVPGTTLNLPIANPAYCPGSRAYVVRDKDTVFRIAKQFNTTAATIAGMNGLGPDYAITVTQVICVPG
jgi:LysM repeat protein